MSQKRGAVPERQLFLAETEHGEAGNLQIAKRALGALWDAADQCVSLYGELAKCITLLRDSKLESALQPTSVLLLAAERSAVIGMLQLGRLHYSEAQGEARRAIEFVGFVRLIWRQPADAELWLRAADDEPSYERYRRAFSAAKLKTALQEIHRGLPDAYDSFSKATHASLIHIVHSYDEVDAGDKFELRINFFDLKPGSAAPLAAYVLAIMRTHLDALQGLARICLAGGPGREARRRWRQMSDPVQNSYRTETRRWGKAVREYLK